jgi:(p)ppGpp synthase/HD superfamily hydrolase
MVERHRVRVIHLLAVTAIVGENGSAEDEVAAALLHDIPEDQGGEERLKAIQERFGEAVAKIVDGCTATYEEPKLCSGHVRRPT